MTEADVRVALGPSVGWTDMDRFMADVDPAAQPDPGDTIPDVPNDPVPEGDDE